MPQDVPQDAGRDVAADPPSPAAPVACPACGATGAGPSHLGEARFEAFVYRYLVCRDCGSLFADPMPGPAVLDRIYAPAYAATHYAAEIAGGSSSSDLLRETGALCDELAAVTSGGRLLDVGCGAGSFLIQARERGFHVEGHELQAESAAAAASRAGVVVHAGSLARLAASYDVVHMADVLEHSPKPLAILRQAVALLAPQGLMVLRGPLENQANLFLWAMRLKRRLRTLWASPPLAEMAPYHVSLFTWRGWRRLLARAELSILRERIYEIHWPAPERFTATAVSIAKTASLAVTDTPIGRRLGLGNRVVTLSRR